jgi:tetratricopeptide (TPR) repeat protein
MHASPNTAAFHPHFAPWLAGPEQLWRTLVGHHDLLREFLARLQATEKGATANHLLLVGPRGIGKTHLLCLADRCVSGRLHVPQDWSGPSKAWTSVFFAEEEYAGQNSLANFLLNLLDKLREALPAEQLWNLPPKLHQQMDQAVIDCCFERMERFDRERGGRILLVIDNLQKVLQQWPEEEHLRLRSFLSRNSLLVILGSAPSVFKEVMDQKAAFHDFFEIRILPELSNEQVLELLARRFEEDGRLGEFEARRAELSKKIPAIEILTGGNPRLVLFLYQIATRSAFLDIELALRNLLEELREYFVRRFDELPDQARKVLDTIAQMSGPATPTEIAEAARLKLALVNAQLKRLKEGHYVRPAKFQRRRATRYDITERLFRIWRQTATVAGRQRFRFLADFLKLYFTPEEIREMYSHHRAYLRAAVEIPRAEIMRHVEESFYFQAAGEGALRYDAFSSRMDSLIKIGEWGWAEEEAQYLAAESLKEHDRQGLTVAYRAGAVVHLQAGRRAEALEDIEKLIGIGANEEAKCAAEEVLDMDQRSPEASRLLGIAAGNMGDHARALEAFRKVAEVSEPTAVLYTYQAIALNNLGRPEEALRCAEQAVGLDQKSARAYQELGVAAGNLGRHERALQAFRKAADVGGPTVALWTNQAGALDGLGRRQEALWCAEQAVALNASMAPAWEALGAAAGNLGQHDRALEAFRKAAELSEPTAALYTYQAIALNSLGRREEALRCAEQAIALDEKTAQAYQELGVAARNLGQYERALEAFRKAADVGGPTVALWTNQAGALDGLGRRQEALLCAEQAVALGPSIAFAWEALGAVANNLGQHERALQAFRRAAELSEPTAALWTNQAIALNALGRRQEALQCAERAIALDEKSAPAHQALGAAAGNLGQHERALQAFRKAADVGGPTAALWTNQAIALNNLGRHGEALRCAEQAIALDERSAPAHQALGVAVGNLGQHERALEAFRKAADVSGPTAALWTNQALALDDLGRRQEALRCAEQAVALDPGMAFAWEALGAVANNLGQHERALQAFRRAAEVSQPTAALWANQAITLNNLGRHGEALRCAEQAVALDPSMARGREQLGVAASSLGQHERALEALCRAAELGGPRSALLTLQAATLRHLGRHQEALGAMDAALALEPGSANSWRQKAWVLSALERFEDSLECLERARQHGANDRDYHHDRGDLLLLSGQFRDALGDLEAGLESQRDDWDLQVDRLIGLGCLGQQGPSMEALPVALAQVQIPPESTSTVHDFMCEIGLHCLRRGEDQISRGLFAASLGMESWQATDWFGKQVGNFLRRVLDVKPGMFQDFARLLAERVKNEGVLRLLDPFLKANDLLQSKDLTILEKLFPELRELVLDIVRHVDPDLHAQFARLT